MNAFHGSDIGYWFGTMPDSPFNVSIFTPFPADYDAHDETLSQAMTNSLVRFAKNGNPNGPDVPKWPSFREGEQYMEFGAEIAVKKGLRTPELDALDKVFEKIRAEMRPR